MLVALALDGSVVTIVHADVTGSYDGTMSGATLASPVPVGAVLTQAGKFVTGTIALGGDQATTGGPYLVHGKATPKRLKLSGSNANGVKLTWGGPLSSVGARGKIKLKGAGKPTVGTLTVTRNLSSGDGASCDAVYTANQTTFTTQVLGQALSPCASCHVSGGQADATRFHVYSADPLATARAVATMVDTTSPAASRLIEKPTLVLPHGGGKQLTPDGPDAQILLDWATLLIQAGCL